MAVIDGDSSIHCRTVASILMERQSDQSLKPLSAVAETKRALQRVDLLPV